MSQKWKTDTEYTAGDHVWCLNQTYVCVEDHKSKVFATDVIERHLWKRA